MNENETENISILSTSKPMEKIENKEIEESTVPLISGQMTEEKETKKEESVSPDIELGQTTKVYKTDKLVKKILKDKLVAISSDMMVVIDSNHMTYDMNDKVETDKLKKLVEPYYTMKDEDKVWMFEHMRSKYISRIIYMNTRDTKGFAQFKKDILTDLLILCHNSETNLPFRVYIAVCESNVNNFNAKAFINKVLNNTTRDRTTDTFKEFVDSISYRGVDEVRNSLYDRIIKEAKAGNDVSIYLPSTGANGTNNMLNYLEKKLGIEKFINLFSKYPGFGTMIQGHYDTSYYVNMPTNHLPKYLKYILANKIKNLSPMRFSRIDYGLSEDEKTKETNDLLKSLDWITRDIPYGAWSMETMKKYAKNKDKWNEESDKMRPMNTFILNEMKKDLNCIKNFKTIENLARKHEGSHFAREIVDGTQSAILEYYRGIE